MNVPSANRSLEQRIRNNLMRILPQNPAGVSRVFFNDRLPQIPQKPCKIPTLGDEFSGSRAKPTDATHFGFSVRPVEQTHRLVQVFIKPVKQLTHFLHLPLMSQFGTIVPDVECRAKNTLVATGGRVPNAGFKSDIHVRILRLAQTFLRKSKTKFDWAKHAVRFSFEFSRLLLQRKTYQSRWDGVSPLHVIAKSSLGKSLLRKPAGQELETIL